MTGLSGREASETFEILNRVKQGCMLAPVFFNLFFTCVHSPDVRDIEHWVYLNYRLDGSLCNLHALVAKTKMVERIILGTLSSDKCAFMAHEVSDLWMIVDKFTGATCLCNISAAPTYPCICWTSTSISIKGTEVKAVEDFKYVRSVISSDGSLDREINARICKASQDLGCLQLHVLNQHSMQQSIKLKVYKAIVLTSLLCIWGLDFVQKALEPVGIPAHAQPDINLQHLMARQDHKPWGPWHGRDHMHQGYDPEGPASMDRACHMNGRLQDCKRADVWITLSGQDKPRQTLQEF